MKIQAEIIAIGNELLLGETLETNSNWIAQRLREMGVTLRRVTIVGDNIEEIVAAIKTTMDRGPNLVLLTGGLGPTEDDVTLMGLAKAMNQKLTLNRKAFKMVKKKYEELAEREIVASADLTPSRTKMATLPEGAEPLSNAVGAAPGVKLIVGDTVIIALPGVPDEMKSVFDLSIPNLIKMRWEPLQVHDVDVSLEVRDESELAPLLAQIQGQVPGVQLKSLPKAYGVDTKLRVRVRAEGSTREECIEKVKRAIEKLKELMENR